MQRAFQTHDTKISNRNRKIPRLCGLILRCCSYPLPCERQVRELWSYVGQELSGFPGTSCTRHVQTQISNKEFHKLCLSLKCIPSHQDMLMAVTLARKERLMGTISQL